VGVGFHAQALGYN